MRLSLILGVIIIMSACTNMVLPPEIRAILTRVSPELKSQQIYVGDPVFIRIFKEENILELWMKADNNYRYSLVKTYPICKWSGRLGPKLREGDYQSPEGFYKTNLSRLNPNSQYHLSFNVGFPNAYDQSYGRTGSFIMIHGDCVSRGCYAMTDAQIEEIYVLSERALIAGQDEIPVHIFPFRMTSERLRVEALSPHYQFWSNLKEGYDYFERYQVPPKWEVIDKKYQFY